jgi:hypothetical protein
VVSAQDDRDRLRDDMIYYRGDTYLVLEATFEEMIMRVMHDTPSVGLLGTCMSMRYHIWQSYFTGRCLDSRRC